MTTINLLPWRATQQQENQQQFIAAIAISVLIALMLLGLIYWSRGNAAEYQNQRNEALTQKIRSIDQQAQVVKALEDKKNKVLDKIKMIQPLQQNQIQVVNVFEKLPKIASDGIVLSTLSLSAGNLIISGKAKYNKHLSNYMRGIEKSSWLKNPTLQQTSIIDRDVNSYSRKFSIYAQYKIDNPQPHENQPK